MLYVTFGDATGDDSGDPVEYADDDEDTDEENIESFFAPLSTAVVVRENIAILSRTLWLHTSSVLPRETGLLITVATFFEPSESVSESVLPPNSVDTKYDDFIVGSSQLPYERFGLMPDVRASVRSEVELLVRSSVKGT